MCAQDALLNLWHLELPHRSSRLWKGAEVLVRERGEKGRFDALMLPGTAAQLSASRVRLWLWGRGQAGMSLQCQPKAHFLGPTRAPKEPLGLARGRAVPNLCVLLARLPGGAGKLPVLLMLILLSGSSINLVLTSLTSF